MSLILSGTDGLSDVDGSASTPAIRGTDTNTGIFFPAADTIAFAEGGAEVARFDSSGNLGVGTTVPLRKITSGGTTGEVVLLGTGADGVENALIGRLSSQTRTAGSASTSSFATIEFRTGGFPWYGGGEMRFLTANGDGTTGAGAERMRLDPSGSLLVGTTTAISGFNMVLQHGSSGAGAGLATVTTTTDAVNAISFRNPNGQIGRVQVSGSTTTYVTSSDYRLKENIAPMTGALAKVQGLKPVTYTWKVDGSNGQGFIAHELSDVVPDCVIGEKDAVNEDGSIDPQGIDTSFLVATLTSAIQEQQAIITDLKSRIEALEAK
jgi:Chaperone of endosialidase